MRWRRHSGRHLFAESVLGLGFRKPDEIPYPARELTRLVPHYQKIAGARAIAGNLTRERNRSPSFQAMMNGVERFASRPYTTHQH